MATTTPNYGWPVPTSSDLVKNGATAIEALGDAADATMATMVAKTVVDAKGDLIAGTAADTVNRLAVGNNGETLVADSSATTGLRYQAPKTQNAIYNSSFDIAQRGTSFTTAGGIAYTLDRWQSWTISAGGSVVTTQETGTSTSRYAVKLRRSTGNTDTGLLALMQTLETSDSFRFQNQTVTLSFWAKAGANFSAASSILQSNLKTGTGTDQNGSSFTGGADNATSHTLTTSWQKFTSTKTLASNLTELALQFYYAPVGTAGADDSFFVTGIQLEVGSVATPYNRMSGTIQGELAACQRYFEKSYDTTVAPGTASQAAGINMATGATSVANNTTYMTPVFRVDKRTTPTVTCYSYAGTSGVASKVSDGLDLSANTATAKNIGFTGFWVYNLNASTFTTTQGAMFQWTASAEL